MTDAAGNFEVGPFDEEDLRIHADSPSIAGARVLAEGEQTFKGELRVDAGSQNVVVQLVPMSGGIEDTVVDDKGLPIEGVARVLVSTPRFEGYSEMAETMPRGEFVMERLVAGSYAVSATLADGRIGVVRDVEVKADEHTKGVRVEVRRGSRLSLVYTGVEAVTNCSIRVGDAVVDYVTLRRGLIETALVPQGDLVVELRDGRERVERSVHVVEGEDASVVLP
jgi:hypothetical protein